MFMFYLQFTLMLMWMLIWKRYWANYEKVNMVSELRWRQSPSKSEGAINEDSWERTKGSMDSPSVFKFTKGKVEAKYITIMAQRKLLMAYLHITSMGSLDLRVKGMEDALLTISSAIMWMSVQMAGTHLLMKITIIPGTCSMMKGMTNNVGHQGNNRLFKESKEPQVWRIKCCFL